MGVLALWLLTGDAFDPRAGNDLRAWIAARAAAAGLALGEGEEARLRAALLAAYATEGDVVGWQDLYDAWRAEGGPDDGAPVPDWIAGPLRLRVDSLSAVQPAGLAPVLSDAFRAWLSHGWRVEGLLADGQLEMSGIQVVRGRVAVARAVAEPCVADVACLRLEATAPAELVGRYAPIGSLTLQRDEGDRLSGQVRVLALLQPEVARRLTFGPRTLGAVAEALAPAPTVDLDDDGVGDAWPVELEAEVSGRPAAVGPVRW